MFDLTTEALAQETDINHAIAFAEELDHEFDELLETLQPSKEALAAAAKLGPGALCYLAERAA